jgi:hypothetical protein
MPNVITSELQTPKRRKDVASRLVDGEMVVLDRYRGFVHQLNKTATFIWEKCDGEHTAAEIAIRMTENFAVDQSTALNDVIEVLNELRELELLNHERN